MRGVRLFGGGHRVSSLIISRSEHPIRFVDSVHTDEGADSVVEF
jgi:fructose-1,6-bisphosphatase/sedoheptulose 1,7-bisphosphatase-like protein